MAKKAPSFSSGPDWRAVAALTAVSALVLPLIFLTPFHSDIDIQQVMGFELLRYHGLPFLGCWDNNFPGTILIHCCAMALFGVSEFSLRLMDLLFQIGTIILLYKISRNWIERSPALLGVALYSVYYVRGPSQFISQKDCFAILPILLGVYSTIAAFQSKTKFHNTGLALNGIFVGVATWIRPTFGLLLIPPFIGLFDLRSASGRRAFLWEGVGFVVVIAIGLVPYALTPNGLYAIYFATIRYNFDVYSHAFDWSHSSNRFWIVVGLLLLWAGAMFAHHRKRRVSKYHPPRREEAYLIGFFAALLGGVIFMRRFAGYQLTPFIACFMPVLAALVWEHIVLPIPKRPLRIALAFAIVMIAYPWHLPVTLLSSRSLTNSIRNIEDDSLARYTADYVQNNSSPTDRVDLATFTAPGPRWRIERPFATRFTTIQCLLTQQPNHTYTNYQAAWQREYVDGLASPHTKFYIVDDPEAPKPQKTTLQMLCTLPGLKSLLENHYHLDTAFGNYLIYRRTS